MSPSAFITRRQTGSGVRYVVRYRLGGRGFKLVHAGSFRTLKDARARREFVISEIAAGRDPRASLAQIATPKPRRTYAQESERFRKSRVDHTDNTAKNIRTHLKRLLPFFGAMDPYAIAWTDIQSWIAAQLEGDNPLKASSLGRYLNTHAQILDFCEVAPNPARDRRVRLPAVVHEEITPPPAAHVLAILQTVSRLYVLPFVAIEQTAMTIGETQQLAWGDVDVRGYRFRLRRATVKAGIRARARWVAVPDWLMGLVEETCPLEDRMADRPVFAGFNPNNARAAMARACKNAKVPHYHPHDLRHRRISLWHGEGVVAAELARRAGHTKASMSLDVYSHVMPLEELPSGVLAALVRERQSSARTSQRAARVRSERGTWV